jgi:hypothetical protein
MNPPAKLSDLILALEMPSEEFRTYFEWKTGAVVSVEETMLSSLEEGEGKTLANSQDGKRTNTKSPRKLSPMMAAAFSRRPTNSSFTSIR